MRKRDEILAAHKIPAWVALRWLLAVIFLGPDRADKYIRPEDRL